MQNTNRRLHENTLEEEQVVSGSLHSSAEYLLHVSFWISLVK
jgi:hypothetical protein